MMFAWRKRRRRRRVKAIPSARHHDHHDGIDNHNEKQHDRQHCHHFNDHLKQPL